MKDNEKKPVLTKPLKEIKKRKPSPEEVLRRQKLISEITGVLFILLGLFSFLAIFFPTGTGILGKSISFAFTDLFGLASFVFSFFVFYLGLMLITRPHDGRIAWQILLSFLFSVDLILLAQHVGKNGGRVGEFMDGLLIKLAGSVGSMFFAIMSGLVLLMILTRLSLSQLISGALAVLTFFGRLIKSFYWFLALKTTDGSKDPLLKSRIEKIPDLKPLEISEPEEEKSGEETYKTEESPIEESKEKSLKTQILDKTSLSIKEKSAPPAEEVKPKAFKYKLPPLELLRGIERTEKDAPTRDYSQLLEETLANFGVEVKVIDKVRGPTVTRYELQPAKGVKVKKVTNLSNDIALALAAYSIRIEAPIPGKSAIGIEVPNHRIDPVYLKDILRDAKYKKQPILSLALGKDITGKPLMDDLLKMPHLLIAGATGSGKSVCLNCVIGSILYKATPEDVQMVMIDPKRVELSLFEGIPHLVNINLPGGKRIITDPKAATLALKTISGLMDQRYEDFVALKVRNIKEFNEKAEVPIPYIIVIIDELADLMMISSQTVEQHICRIAQLGRASGIHLIVATQRPSVDVITGLIKANIPSRIAFAVSSQVDSRTILDRVGAEKLLGKGDMLYSPVDASEPRRIQGAYVSGEEIESVVEFWRRQPTPENAIPIVIPDETEKGTDGAELAGDEDELIPEAINVIRSTRQASVSNLQRKMKIGYARAGRIMDQLEKKGYVGPADGSKPRKILLPGFTESS